MMHTILNQQAKDPAMATPAALLSSLASQADALAQQGLTAFDGTTPTPGVFSEPMVLTALQLGPHLQVITPQTAAPEGQSLEMFARSQGLDEAALQWLMGTSGLVSSPSAMTLGGAVASDKPHGLLPAAPVGTVAILSTRSTTDPVGHSTPQAQNLFTSPSPQPHNLSSGPSPQPMGSAAGLLPASPVGTVEVLSTRSTTDLVGHSTLQAQNLIASPSPQPMSSAGLAGGPTPLAGGPAGTIGLTGNADPIRPDDLTPITITVMKTAAETELQKAPPAWFAMAAHTSEQLKNNALELHSIQPSVLGKLEPIQKTLDLSNLITPDLQLTLDSMSAGDMSSGQESPAHGQGHFSGRPDQTTALVRSESSANGAATTDMDPAQRRESIQNLAEKMGQAVGQRILSEIERGQWHLKLSLRPATLGHIEVEMRMRSGEMDAVFTAGQALTRELLNEGMSKLKDTLNQMGMDVASLKVDDGHNRQRGGDSTPDRQANVRDNAPTESADAAASQPVLVQTKMGSEGWDVLV